MKKVYLKDGQEVILHKKLEDGTFVIESIFTYYGHEGEEYSEPSGEKKVVDEILEKPPIEKRHDELILLIEKITNKNEELKDLENQIYQIKREIRETEQLRTNLDSLIVNRGELKSAKRYAVFELNKIKPIIIDNKGDIMLSIDLFISGIEKQYYYKIADNGYKGDSYHIDPNYGIIMDFTDEEIIEITKERSKTLEDIRDHQLVYTQDIYLTDELLKRKHDCIKVREKDEKEKISQQIFKLQEELKNIVKNQK